MVEINTSQLCYPTRQFSFDAVLGLLSDDFIPDDDYIEFVMADGLRAAIRKKDIVSINEIEEANV